MSPRKNQSQPDLFGGAEAPAATPASAPAPRERTGRLAHIELVEGDFLQRAIEFVPDGSMDVIVTSPPYNIGIDYASYSDNLPREDYLQWTARWAAEVRRCLAPRGSFFLNVGVRPTDPWLAWDVARVAGEIFKLQNTIHWVKSIHIAKRDVGRYPGVVKDVTVGHYKPINSNRYVNDQHEYIFHFTHEGDVELDRTGIGVPYQDESNATRWKKAGNGLHCRGNTWFIPYKTIKFRDRDRPHPASFPDALPEMCCRLHGTLKTRRMMDPFLGLGSTALAAQRLGIDAVGFDLDASYLEAAHERLLESGMMAELQLHKIPSEEKNEKK